MKTAGNESSPLTGAGRHARPPLLYDRLAFEERMNEFRSARERFGPFQRLDTAAEQAWEDEGGARLKTSGQLERSHVS